MAHVAYITINGEKQGLISSGCNTKDSMGNKYQESHTDEITLLSCDHSLSKDPQQHGKTHNPMCITKSIDKSSPLLSTAFAKQEFLNCVINFYRTNEQGYNEKFYSVELKKAIISGIHFSLPHTINSHGDDMYEIIELSYQEIIWNHNISGTMGYDNWDQGGWVE
ncbi:Hcp family type VI secretion system effector [Vibrio mangrovi]|uniref:Hcp family type VI secretion system effector n=1 Tax=Vibrio mangrovi TaxID=474394 RepID=A0A1Y6IXH6_9VIBR|nr:Hcp family type VI secretion system effector [Vibrio mangrovi]MDW6002857.1 Hcp family type VI secretion system effector [Vibrio mangrovi]SMS02347.1 Major exported protein [Vibrio mangrovi]